METLADGQQPQPQPQPQSNKTPESQSNQKPKTSFSDELTEQILTRLPVKSILRFRSVSKPFLSLISTPSFTTLQLTRATAARRTATLISAYDPSTHKRHLLSLPHNTRSVTHIATLDNCRQIRQSEHLNGLVCFTAANTDYDISYAFVVNPSTRKIFKLPDPEPLTSALTNRNVFTCYLFGFDDTRNEHKIVNITVSRFPEGISTTVAVSVFSLSSYEWRTVNVSVPSELERYLSPGLFTRSVCAHSVIYFMLRYGSHDVFAFDLRTECFSKVSTPEKIVPVATACTMNGNDVVMYKIPRVIKVNGCVGFVCGEPVGECREMYVWMLRDYERRVWVRETIVFPEAWDKLGCPFPLDSVIEDEIVFSSTSRNVISVPVYNIKSGCFKSGRFTLSHPVLSLDTWEFEQIKCYVESVVPLESNCGTGERLDGLQVVV